MTLCRDRARVSVMPRQMIQAPTRRYAELDIGDESELSEGMEREMQQSIQEQTSPSRLQTAHRSFSQLQCTSNVLLEMQERDLRPRIPQTLSGRSGFIKVRGTTTTRIYTSIS